MVLDDIKNHFRNKVLNILGIERDIHTLLADKDVDRVIDLLQNRDDKVDEALSEYDPKQHKVMHRPNKERDNDDPYITEKLPRNLQSYINEIELFFLLGQPIIWSKTDGEDEAFTLFTDFWKEHRLDAKMRKVKRLAGAETEAALVFHIYQENEEVKVIPYVAARSTGYKLRPLFDQYGQMTAFAVGYTLKENIAGEGMVNVSHWDILTKDTIYYCKKGKLGWDVKPYKNPIEKIPAIYFMQPKAWAGAEERLDRIEMLDSKTADTNNYFADPIAAASADVINSMAAPDKPGRLIQLTGSSSRFEYIQPPSDSATRVSEKEDLKTSVLFDTMTPNFDVEKMRGFGTLTGAAIKNTFAIGYIKRDNRKEDYDENVDRLRSVIMAILKLQHENMGGKIDATKIKHEFADPFSSDKEQRWIQISSLYGSGLVSLETAVSMLALTDAPEDEVARLHSAAMDEIFTANEAKGEPTPSMAEQEEEAKTGIRPVAQEEPEQ